LRSIVRRQRKDLRARMIEVSREEAERKRMLDERAKNRFVCLFNMFFFYAYIVKNARFLFFYPARNHLETSRF
jgi:hypothetical protein